MIRHICRVFFVYTKITGVLIAASVLLVTAGANELVGSSLDLADGKINFSTMVHDFGVVRRGDKLTHRFSFKNIGGASVSLTGVHASCGCTVTKFEENRPYEVDSDGFVEVSLDTTNFNGKIAKTVTVITSERLMPTRNLTLKAEVVSDYSAEPPVLEFGEVRVEDSPEKSVLISSLGEGGGKVGALRYNKNIFDARIEGESSPWKLIVKLSPKLPAGFLKETIHVQTSSSSLKELPILVRADVVGSIKLSPAYVEFGALTPGQKVVREISVGKWGQYDVTTAQAELNINGNKIPAVEQYIKIENSAERGKLVATLLHPSDASGSVHGRINVLTSDPAQNKVSVDFYAFFREGK